MNFFTGAFAVAGLLAATGPILIHLLNRRRFRVVNWAAMDFLKEALQRNRKVLQLRDLLLLMLRVLCVIFFGLALARPYFSQAAQESLVRFLWLGVLTLGAFGTAIWAVLSYQKSVKLVAGVICLVLVGLGLSSGWNLYQDHLASEEGTLSNRQPIHAVLVIDNSLSMNYRQLSGTLLDEAKKRAADFVDTLPPQSRVSVIPLCGSVHVHSLDAYRNLQDAQEAIDRIQTVDRSGSTAQALELAAEACNRVPELTAKRVVFLSDQQRGNWPSGSLRTEMDRLPELQLVQVGEPSTTTPQNVWISDFRLQDGIADNEIATNFLVEVSYTGTTRLSGTQVTLSVDEISIASQTIDLEPGQTRQLEFQHVIDIPADPGQPKFVTAQASLTIDSVEGDRLEEDNTRLLAVPVVAGLPVVFVDQYGEQETPNQRGETYRLRRLLAPNASRDKENKQLIRIRHTTIDKLSTETLQDARLVVIAGVKSPEPGVKLLRQYVEQGGQLVIAAGGNFDPALWNEHAWLKGAGILPVPLGEEPIGKSIEELIDDAAPSVYRLDFSTMLHDFFLVEGEPRELLRTLYNGVVFFKLLDARLDADEIEEMIAEETKRIEANREQLAESNRQREKWLEMERLGTLDDEEQLKKLEDAKLRKEFDPNWLLWQQDAGTTPGNLSPAELAEASRPQVLASFQGNQKPFLVNRDIGRGRVLFFSSGVFSEAGSFWNTLTSTKTFFVFDRIFRRLLEDTLPQRTYDAGAKVTLPAEASRQYQHTLQRPSGLEENLPVLALGPDVWGVTIPTALESGRYLMTSSRIDPENPTLPGEKIAEIPLVMNGPAAESELATVSEEDLEDRLGEDANYRWIPFGEEISLEGAQIRGRDLWKLLIQLAIVCLLLEMLILSWTRLRRGLQSVTESEGVSQ